MIVLATIVLVAGTVLDVISTLWALRAGARETTSIFRVAGAAWIWLRVGLTGLAAFYLWRDPSTEACRIAIAAGALWIWMATLNVRNARRRAR